MAQNACRKKLKTKLFSEFSKIFNFHDFWPKNRSKIAEIRVFFDDFETRPWARFWFWWKWTLWTTTSPENSKLASGQLKFSDSYMVIAWSCILKMSFHYASHYAIFSNFSSLCMHFFSEILIIMQKMVFLTSKFLYKLAIFD